MLGKILFLAALALASSAPNPNNVFQIDITPEEAQKYLNSPPFTEPQLSGRTAVLPLVRYNDPRFRTAEAGPTLGHYWKNGHEIENTDDYVEEVYNAAQFHGQDGLGAYSYGYEAPESAKVEDRQRSGNVKGAYTYRAANNDLVKVRYWADSQGFHQEDNLPKVTLKQVEEAPEVRAARLAHEKAWQEAAAATLLNPNAHGLPNTNYDYQPQASEVQSSVVPAPRVARAYYEQNYQNEQGYTTTTTTTEEPTGPPRGFFYSYTYPVSIITKKSEHQPNAKYAYTSDQDSPSASTQA